jgi:NAD(P)H-hydrate epimerase
MLGSASLCSTAALRAGAGMVRLASPGVDPAAGLPASEIVRRSVPGEDWAPRVLDDLSRSRVLVLGPGLGSTPATAAGVRRLLIESAVPVVLDADGLGVIGTADHAGRLLALRRAPVVMTPHDGEYARLVGAQPGRDRIDAAVDLAERSRAVVLLKGPTTVVASPEGDVLLGASGLSSLATAGTGDVLTGVVAAFLAKGLEPRVATAAAAVAHGLASRLVEPQAGLVASDLLPGIRRAIEGEGWEQAPLE